tara:strand:+ start:228 stop:1142 length:915 start_codon:yes stop_codon:yes gene_type:complete
MAPTPARLTRQSTLFAVTRDVEEHGGVTLRPHHRTDSHYNGSSSSSSSSASKKKPRSTRKRKATPTKKSAKKVKHWSASLEAAQIALLRSINVEVADLADVETKPAPLWTPSEVHDWAEGVAGRMPASLVVSSSVTGPALVASESEEAAAALLFISGTASKTIRKRVWKRLAAVRKAVPASLEILADAAEVVEANDDDAVANGAFVVEDPSITSKCYSISCFHYFVTCIFANAICIALLLLACFAAKSCIMEKVWPTAMIKDPATKIPMGCMDRGAEEFNRAVFAPAKAAVQSLLAKIGEKLHM